MEEKEALSQLRFIEQELADVMEAVAGRVADEDVRDGLYRIAEQHSQQAQELNEVLEGIGGAEQQPSQPFREHVEAVGRGVMHARDADGLFGGLADAERLDVELHEISLAEGFPAPAQALIGEQTGQDREHLDFLESRAPGITSTVRGVESVPKRGTVE